MEISLFQAGETLRFERIVLYPYPDLKRVWARAWVTAVEGQSPNIEIIILNADGSENASVFAMAHAERRLETTLHLRNPRPGNLYRVVALLTVGMNEQPEEVDRQEFELLLEFRDPQKNEPGFGIGVDWTQIQKN